MVNYVYGLGGRDIIVEHFKEVAEKLEKIAETGKVEEIYGYLKPSRHLDTPCGAVDLRCRDFTLEEILRQENWMEYWYGDWGVRLIHHDVGRGEHIHVQVPKLIAGE